MNIGEIKQFACWLSGHETREDLTEFAEGVEEAMKDVSRSEGVLFGPTTTNTLYPGDPHVPPVPDHVHGPDVRLLVVEAPIIGFTGSNGKPPSWFTDDLEPDDLARLRVITRSAYERHMPGMPRLTDRQCDTLINDLGPEAAADALRRGAVGVLLN